MTNAGLFVLSLGLATLALAIACNDQERELRFAAESICPEAPDEVLDDLRSFEDSWIPKISAKSTNNEAHFQVHSLDSPNPYFGPTNRAGTEYMESMPASCFAGPPPTHSPTPPCRPITRISGGCG